MKKLIIMTFACFLFVSVPSFAQLKGMLKKAKDKTTEKATTTPSKGDLIQSDACIENVKSRCETIINVYYKNYTNNSKEYLSKEGNIWFARKDLEAARFYYTGGKEGYTAGGRQCEMGAATADPRYKDLKAIFDEAESKVKELEKAKGLEFVGVKPENNVIFKNLTTGKELTSSESNKQ